MQKTLRVAWQVTPLQCPLVWRRCSRCNSCTPFACSMKFRTNAQKKRIDIWLIYRCGACGETWNMPVLERAALGDIAPDELQAIARNDPAHAEFYAFDRARLNRHSDRVEEGAASIVEWRLESGPTAQPCAVEISIRLVLPWHARLDRFLAQQFGMGRDRLRALQAVGSLAMTPPSRKGLRSPITDGQRILITTGKDDAGLELIAAIRDRVMPSLVRGCDGSR